MTVDKSVFLSSQTVEWSTDDAFFEQVNREFNFTVDVAADSTNAKCERFYDIDSDGLMQNWDGETVWCNPPYGRRIADWIYKAAVSEATTVLLVPARTDVKWFHEIVIPRAEVRFIKGRLKFGNSKDNAPFPTMLVIFRNAAKELANGDA